MRTRKRRELFVRFFVTCLKRIKDESGEKHKVFYALKLFGDIVRRYATVCGCETKGPVAAFSGGRLALTRPDAFSAAFLVEFD